MEKVEEQSVGEISNDKDTEHIADDASVVNRPGVVLSRWRKWSMLVNVCLGKTQI